MNTKPFFAGLLICCTLIPIMGNTAHADELSTLLESKVQSWKTDDFEKNGVKSLSVGEFQYLKDKQNINGGLEIANKLKNALQLLDVAVNNNSAFTMYGTYNLNKSDDARIYEMQIAVMLARRNGQVLNEFRDHSMKISEPELIAKLMGLTVELLGRDVRDEQIKLARQIDNPKVSVKPATEGKSGTVVRSSDSSPYGIEILVRNSQGEFLPRGVQSENNQANTRLQMGDVYQIRLINDSDEPAAIELLLDGLSILALHENENIRNGRIIVNARSSTIVKGWFQNNRPGGGNELEIGKMADSIAAKSLPPGKLDIGMITATFARAWDVKNPPHDVLTDIRSKSADEQIANVLGNKIDLRVEVVDYDFGRVRNVVTVRYNKGVPADLPK